MHIHMLEMALFEDCDYPDRKDSLSVTGTMPFPPGVGGRSCGDIVSNTENYEVITADRAIDESNVGNRMLRSMGWQEGLVPPFLCLLFVKIIENAVG